MKKEVGELNYYGSFLFHISRLGGISNDTHPGEEPCFNDEMIFLNITSYPMSNKEGHPWTIQRFKMY
jgi:hypothetical protein